MDLPQYRIVGMRPVKLVETADGGMDCLAYDWDTGLFTRHMEYSTRALMADVEVDVVSEEEFNEAVRRLRRKRRG